MQNILGLFIITMLINAVYSINDYDRITNVEDIQKVFNNDPNNIKYASVNVTRTRSILEASICCINIFGESLHCSVYDLHIEYHGKIVSESIDINCPDVIYVDYRIERKIYVGHVISISVGVILTILLGTIIGLYIAKKIKDNKRNIRPTATTAAN